MSIIRVRKDARYFSASNEPFNDTRLSWESRGLMGYLLSKPNGWQVRMDNLEKQGPAGNFKLRRMLAELRSCGYMNRIRVIKEDKTFDWITDVYESPSQNPNPSTGFIKASGGKSTSGKATSGSSTSGKPHDIGSTDESSTEEVNTESSATAVQAIFSFYEENFEPLVPAMKKTLLSAVEVYTEVWVIDALQIAVEYSARNWKYCAKILKRWMEEGRDESKQAEHKTTWTDIVGSEESQSEQVESGVELKSRIDAMLERARAKRREKELAKAQS